jgi:M6 family metalloprotease-like protein
MKRLMLLSSALAVAFALALFPTVSAQQKVAPVLAPLDPQQVRDQDDMTWDDYRPVPGTNWANPDGKATDKTLRIAIITADFEDQPFVMTLPLHSDLFGNPQIAPIKREQIPQFYADFWNKPQSINRGHTIHEYWMEVSRGKVGITVQPFGPYRLTKKSFQYGMPQNDMPEGYTADRGMNAEVDALWKADAGQDVAKNFDIVLRIFAGYDETCVWQEFGEMKFQNRDSILPEWGNPDPTKPRWARTRYTDWTSWKAASYLWSNSAIIQGESSGSIRHEISHFAFKIGDNNNNPYVQPYRRTGAGPWDIMDRGSFNGPGGPHRRWLIPVMEGGSAPAGLMLRQMINFGFVKKEEALNVTRDGLAQSGLVVADVTAREAAPAPGALPGIVVRLDGTAPVDRTPPDDPAVNPLSPGNPNYTFYTLEVVQRIGYDSFTPDSGVLIAKNKDVASTNGGPNAFNVFNWVIDAHPEDVHKLDFKRPDGTSVMRTIADYRQLNDALFHVGLNSGSQFEWEDTPNRLHFYVIDLQKAANGVRTYTLGVRSLDGAGPQSRGVTVAAPASPQLAGQPAALDFTLKNTGTAEGAAPHADSDLYRLEVSVDGKGWTASLQNGLAAVKAGGTKAIPVYVTQADGSAASANVTLKAVSESDPSKTSTATATLKK